MSEFNGIIILPSENDVEAGIMYGTSGIEFTGNMIPPSSSQVIDGVEFGGSGTEFTGTFTC
jgi:hypothetical protein